MPTVCKFDRSMIEKHLKSEELYYLVDSEGGYRVDFEDHDNSLGCDLTAWLGEVEEVLSIFIGSTRQFPKREWGRAIMLCNTWNKENPGPKAFLDTNPDTDTTGSIVLRQSYDLEQGIHQELLDDFITVTIGAAIAFWEWAHQEQGL